ncbi:TetR/AcrR family transcriptional regulator [Streptomyces sp. NPDC058256]|uniref:TetR/AcrR family transcriptional regulator n=1 Tax=Streptomyces sp. NPDC058256 TaxID=3346408 RepID=UPI0036E76484
MRNQAGILSAAQEMFVEQGLAAPLDEIARRAGVGNATLYRHFPGRDALLAEVVEQIAVIAADAAEEAAVHDPFVALSHFVLTVARERLAALCCLSEELVRVRPELAQHKDRLMHSVQLLLTRAQQTGQVRTDVSLEEIIVAVAQLSRPMPGVSWSATNQFSPRLLQLYLDGLITSDPV